MPHLIAFSHLRWNFLTQRPQHLLSRLARWYDVLFVEEPVHDAQGGARLECSEPAAGVTVLSPHTPVEAAGFHDDQLPLLKTLLAGHLREHAIESSIAWLTTPMALPLLAELNPRAVVYDCMVEPAALKDAPRQMRQREAALLKWAEVVLAAGPSLYEAKRQLHSRVLCLPSAVEARHFAPQAATARLDAMLQAERVQGRIAGPRLGFYGAIDERLDTGLLSAMADAEPDWQLVMVGPVGKIDAATLPQRPNIHWLGPQPYALLPQLVADWDVCLLPFAQNEATRFINPMQTLEYMAAEKPIVSSALHDVIAMHGDVVRIGHDKGSFIEACRWALSETPLKRAERIGDMLATVSRFSWDTSAQVVHEVIAQTLASTPLPQPQSGQQVPAGAFVGKIATVGNLALHS